MSTRGSGACRMSIRARPSVSSARVSAAGAMRLARSAAVAPLMLGQARRWITHRGQEGVTQPGQHHLADGSRIPPPPYGVAHGRQRGGPVTFSQSAEYGVGRRIEVGCPAASHHPLEGR